MSELLFLLISRFLILVGTGIIFYCFGLFIVKSIFKIQLFQSEFDNGIVYSMVGCIISTCLFASFTTNLKTILIVPFLFLLMILIQIKKVNFETPPYKYASNVNIKHLILLTIISVLTFLFFASYLYKTGSFNYQEIHRDEAYYSNVINCLLKFGVENTFTYSTSINNKLYHGTSPYHFFDLWLPGIVSFIFPILPIESFKVIIPTYSSSLFILIVYRLLSFYQVKPKYYILIIGTYVAGCIIPIDIPNTYFVRFDTLFTASTHFKNAIYFPLMMICVILLTNKKMFEGLITLLLLGSLNIQFLPVTSCAVICFSFYSYYKSKTNLQLGIYAACVIVAFFIFYSLFGNKSISTLNSNIFAYSDLTGISLFQIKYTLVEFVYRVGHKVIFIFTYLLPILGLFAFYFNQKKTINRFSPILIIYCFLLLAGIFIHCFFL